MASSGSTACRCPTPTSAAVVNDILEGKQNKIILIKADEDAPYGRVMEAMDTLRAAGIEDMGLITERKAQAGGN